LLSLIGIDSRSRHMEVPVRSEDERAAEDLLSAEGIDRSRPVVMLNPGASGGPSKMWIAARYGALADALMERRGAQIIVNAAPREQPWASRVASAMRNKPAIDFARRRNHLGLLKSLMRRCTLLVTNDTGARHIAAASGIHVVTIFGSTDPNWTTLYYDRERMVRAEVNCSPCQERYCRQPGGRRYHQCMTAVTVERVLSVAEDVLGQVARQRTDVKVGARTSRDPKRDHCGQTA
jgi:heptosyltransferase-2